MTAITQRLLHLRLVLRPHLYSLHHFFSSSDSGLPSNIPPRESESEPESRPKPSFSSYFSDVKATLQREPHSQNRSQSLRKPHSFSNSPQNPPPSQSAYEEIRRSLAEYRIRSAPPPPSSTSGQYVPFQELYKRNLIAKDNDAANSPAVKPHTGASFDTVRQSLLKLRENLNSEKNQSDQVSISRFKESLKVKPDADVQPLVAKMKNMMEDDNAGSKTVMRNLNMRGLESYNYSELGSKLKMLRPGKKKGKWFSLRELSERLAKLTEVEKIESHDRNIAGISVKDLKETMEKLARDKEEEKRKKSMHRLDILGQLGGTPSFMLSDPKDHLVEKYFHPDNMSSAEKLKLELKKVRDEFKMSESDCGSARVQVAQLTTKIKHLSSVLQKKDKHSRRGLQAMVQRRKKLLKYLRRTDWDSYCLVLSKLGLRDSPEVKA